MNVSETFLGIISADEFITALQSGDTSAIERKRVRGAVLYRGKTIEVRTRALYVNFEGEVDFTGTTFQAGADFSGCTFARTFSLHSASVGGDLTMEDMVVLNTPSPPNQRLRDAMALDLSGLKVQGELILNRTIVQGALMARALKSEGNASFLGCEVDADVTLDNSQFEGDLVLGSWIDRTSDPQSSDYREGFIRGNLTALNLRVRGAFMLLGLQVGESFTAWGANFESSILGEPCIPRRNGDEVKAIGNYVRGDLNFTASKVAGHFQLRSTRVGGLLNLHALEAGTVLLESAEAAAGPCIVGGLHLNNARIKGDVRLPLLVVTGIATSGGPPGVRLNGATIGGTVTFWRSAEFDEEKPPASTYLDIQAEGACIAGHLSLGAIIGGECNLTNIHVAGAIRLNDSRVGGDIAFRSRTSLLEDTLTSPALRDRLRRGEGHLRRARAASLDLTMSRCDNDVDLTGLDLTPAPPSPQDAQELMKEIRVGCLIARGLEAKGDVTLFIRNEHGMEDRADIPGAADFRNLKTFQFVVSAHSFDQTTNRKEDVGRFGLNLAAAEIGELKIATLARRRTFGERLRREPAERFPRPLDLHGLSVRTWGIGGLRRADQFKALLACDPVFRRDTYARTEQAVRNGGHESDANEIYRAAQRRARGQVWRDTWRESWWWRPPFTALYELLVYRPFAHLLGHGTSPLRLLGVIALLWLAMMPVYYARENYEPSPAYRAQLLAENKARPTPKADPAEEPKPPADVWQGYTPFFTSLRYHLPTVGVGAHDEWTLSDKPHLYRTLPDPIWKWTRLFTAAPPPSQEISTLSPADLGVLISILNWALWPLVLTFSIRKMLR